MLSSAIVACRASVSVVLPVLKVLWAWVGMVVGVVWNISVRIGGVL